MTRYDAIGATYAQTRREDPRIADRLAAALGDARTVVNVGAGTGSYEPDDRHVVAIEPSAVMIAQRGPQRVPAVQAGAAALPLLDGSVDAAMAILTVHHWDARVQAGVRELRRALIDDPGAGLPDELPEFAQEGWNAGRDPLPQRASPGPHLAPQGRQSGVRSPLPYR